MQEQVRILVSGQIDLQTIGRQVVGFIGAFLHDERNKVYLDASWLDGNAMHVLEEIWGKELVDKVSLSTELPENFVYDFLVYPWVFGFACSPKFAGTLTRYAKVKICYPVYDGSVPPLEWIPLINQHFDICVCPSDYCAHNLRRYGVTVDCFGLELVVLIADFFRLKKRRSGKFRFGCLSASEKRKNLPLLIESFKKAFGHDPGVELVIKTLDRGDVFASLDALRKLVTPADTNIILQTEFLSHADMESLIESLDVYVNPQTTVGFYTSSVEMLPLGIPQILSDIPVHREFEKVVPAKNTIMYVSHTTLEREFHAAFDYRQMGVNFQASVDDYVTALRTMYEHRDTFISDALVRERRNAARAYLDHTIRKYNQMIHPDAVAVSPVSGVVDGVFFMSERLLNKYRQIFATIRVEKMAYPLPPTVYPEENDPVFQAIERIAVRDQTLYLSAQMPMEKYVRKILDISEKRQVNVPYMLYKLFKIYAKIVGRGI